MATDMFGNILSPEEEERLRIHQQRLGITPNAVPLAPSLYPNQAAPYRSFGTTPSVGPYQTSPFMKRQEPAVLPWDTSEPAPMYGPGSDPRLGWKFNNDPIALNEALSKPSFTDPLNVLNQEATGTITPTEDVNLAAVPANLGNEAVTKLGSFIDGQVGGTPSWDATNYGAQIPGMLNPVSTLMQAGFAPTIGKALEFMVSPANADSGVPAQTVSSMGLGISPITGATVPSIDASMGPAQINAAMVNKGYGDPTLSGELGSGMVPHDRWGAVTPEEGEVHDVHRHMGLTMGIWPEEGDYMDMRQQGTNLVTQLPSVARKFLRDRSDTIGQFLGDETNTDKLQDLINNQIAEDTDIAFTNQELTQAQKYRQAIGNPNVVYDKSSLDAMVELAKQGRYKTEQDVQDAINEIKSGVDTFTAGPTEAQKSAQRQAYDQNVAVQAAPAQPAGPSAADIQRDKQAAVDARLAQQAAAAQKHLEDSRAAAARAQAASAAQAQAAQNAARVLLDRAASSDRSPYSEAEINAAREVLSQIDTFASGNPFEARQNAGPAAGYGGYRGDPVGRQAAIESRGGGRNGGGRSHGGGHHGR